MGRKDCHHLQSCFYHIDREFNDRQRRMRLDLSIFDLPGPYRNVILDIYNICPIPIFVTQQYSRNDDLIIQKAAQEHYDERIEKFNPISTAHGIKFHPIIFETTVNPFDICNLNFVISLATWMVSYCKLIGLIVYLSLIHI